MSLMCLVCLLARGTSWILELLAVLASCKDPKTDNEAAENLGVMAVLKSFIFEERGVRCRNPCDKGEVRYSLILESEEDCC